MADPEPFENGLPDGEPRHFGDIGGNTKMAAVDGETLPVKQNGISSEQPDIDGTNNEDRGDIGNELDADNGQKSIGSVSDNEDSVESNTNEVVDPHNDGPSRYRDLNLEDNLSFSALTGAENENSVGASTDKSDLLKSEGSEESCDSLRSGDNSRNTSSDVKNIFENVEDGSLQSSAGRDESSPVVLKSDDSSVMEVGEDDDDLLDDDDDDDESPTSEIVELDSNISAPNSDVMEVDDDSGANAENNSLNPSIISEDSSKDSIDSSISNRSAENLSFLNEAECDRAQLKSNDSDSRVDDNSTEAEKSENVDRSEDDVLKEIKSDEPSKEGEKTDIEKKINNATISMDTTESDVTNENLASNKTISNYVLSTKVESSAPTTTTESGQPTKVVSTSKQVTNTQKQTLPKQSQQGYIAKIGTQHVFVPVSNASGFKGQLYPAIAEPLNSTSPTTGTPSQQPIKPEDLQPKSSLEMMELMKWELQNRIPDNYNWSVAFHPKKDELSTITSFLLDLGHDVVKEAVYKDIIEIQTKKKESGTLKETEIDSLGKMKMVYENTRKRVEHLNLPMKKCKRCRFRTESDVILRFHTDHPHYEPSWDHPSAQFCCSHCLFKTKQAPEFSFHMESVHGLQAKMMEKPSWFPCEMCPLDPSTKTKLAKHRLKCLKSFKLNINLQPYYHDVNFCMKTCYYKPKKVIPKPIPAKKALPQPVRPPANTRSNPSLMPVAQIRPPFASRANVGVRTPIMYAPQGPPNRAIRSGMRHLQPTRPNLPNRLPVVRDLLPSVARQNLPPGLQARLALSQSRLPQPSVRPPVKPPGKEMSGFEVCELCGGYVKDRQALRIHFYYAHKVEMPQAIFNRPTPPLCCEVCQSRFWTTQGLSKHKATLRHYQSVNSAAKQATSAATGNDQQCFMCTRRVPNLFVHIEQIHGMTMKDLVAMKKCIMCGITAADRRQLEIHMASAHGVLIKANDFLGPEKSPAVKSPAAPIKPSTPAASPSGTTKGGKALVRNNLCVFCQVQFADNTQLTLHCIKNHATCRACGMVVASNKHLANHHCKKMMRDCVICGLRKLSPDSYAVHVKKHVKPCKIKVMRLTEEDIKSAREKIKREYKPQIISLDSDDSDVEVVVDDDDNKSEAKKDIVDNSGRQDTGNSLIENRETDLVAEKNGEGVEISKDAVELKSDADIELKKENENRMAKNTEAEEKTTSEIKCEKEDGLKECDETELSRADECEMENEESLEKSDVEAEAITDVNIKQENEANVKVENVEGGNNDDKTVEAAGAEVHVKTEDQYESDVGSETNRKRKKSDSDFDEDELLRDDTESKRLKVEEDCSSDEGSDHDSNLGVSAGIDMAMPNCNTDNAGDNDPPIKSESDINNEGTEYSSEHLLDNAVKSEMDMAVDSH